MALVLPGSSIGRYLVKRKLAEGGMAELYLCTAVGPEGFEKEVVIKRIKEFLSSDQGFIDMFKAEARLASRLNHANVVQIFDFDKHDNAWFIAMEYVYGASLWELRRRCRELAMPFPPILVAEIGAQVARGLHYAHTLSDKGKPLALVHRDVTPHNVLLSFDGGVKLTDFGIAKAGTSFTAPGMLKGKFAYMSPEQARGEKVDARTDVFALGITLWEMLTGGRLFEGDSDIAVLRAVQESLIASPARLNPDVPAELSEIVLKALARPVADRFQTSQELDRALAHFVLKSSSSPDDANVGLFLRQMFRDELEAADRALSSESEPVVVPQAEASRTPVVDAYAFGDTKQHARIHDPATQQTATPLPMDRPKTSQMPGIRSAPRVALLFDDGDPLARPTEKFEEFVGGRPRVPTQPQIKKVSTVPSPRDVVVPAPFVLPPPDADISQEISGTLTEPTSQKKSLLPWILAACVSVGLIAGLGIAVQQSRAKKAERDAAVAVKPVAQPPPVAIAEKPPAPVEPAPAPVVVAEKPTPDVEPAPVQKTPTAIAKGTLAIDARPYGTLFVNNKEFRVIEGPDSVQLPPGTYAVRLEHPKRIQRETVVIKSGQTVQLRFRPLP